MLPFLSLPTWLWAPLLVLSSALGPQDSSQRAAGFWTVRQHVIVERFGIRGGELSGNVLTTWGDGLSRWNLPSGEEEVLQPPQPRQFGEAGCLLDVDGDGRDDIVLQRGWPEGELIWRQASTGTVRVIDTGVQVRDMIAARFGKRRGVLLLQRGIQARFYEVPEQPHPKEPWPQRDIYSFYSASQQGGLLLADIDGDGRTDILCGNYWLQQPEEWDHSWRLFAINLYHETVISALHRLEYADLTGDGVPELIAAERELRRARLHWFTKPKNVREQWPAHPLEGEWRLRRPQGLLAHDLDRDGHMDILMAENDGPGSRLVWFRNRGGGQFDAVLLGETNGTSHLWEVPASAAGPSLMVSLGPRGITLLKARR
jgi:hypothetical protein